MQLEAGELQSALAAIAGKYPGDDASQLGAAADWFVSAFKSCELPFNKAVTEGPLEKACIPPLFSQAARQLFKWSVLRRSSACYAASPSQRCVPPGSCGPALSRLGELFYSHFVVLSSPACCPGDKAVTDGPKEKAHTSSQHLHKLTGLL